MGLVRFFLIACATLLIGTTIGIVAGKRGDSAAAPPVARGRIETAAPVAAPRAVPAPPTQPAWMRNAVVTVVPPGRIPVAIVIDDVGVDRPRSERAAGLPAPLTLAFLPYARHFEAQIAAAHARGHEILVHVPMQPVGAEDPGPDALTVALDATEIRKRLSAALDRAGPAVGINNHMGSRFTVDRDAMRPVLEELQARGLLFLDSRTAGGSVGPSLARTLAVPYATRDVFLDNDATMTAVEARLAELEAVARRQGHGIAIGHPHDATLAALAAWLPTAASRGFALVPVSTIVRQSLERQQRG
jgi:polysaccharide deacetylase 2 family uncharacterized protein YibQ